MRKKPVIDLLEASVKIDVGAVVEIRLSRVVEDAVLAFRLAAGSRDFT